MLESTRVIDTVVLDKTGTITTGKMRLVDVTAAAGEDWRKCCGWPGQSNTPPVIRSALRRGRCDGQARPELASRG